MLILKGHDPKSAVWSVAFSPDGTLLASSADNVRLWDFNSGGVRVVADRQYANGLNFTPDGDELAWSDWRGVSFWNVATEEVRRIEIGPLQHSQFAFAGRTLAVSGGSVCDYRTNQVLSFDYCDPSITYAVTFSPDGQMLAMSHWIQHRGESGEHFIRLTDTATGKERNRIEGHGGAAKSLSFRPDGRVIAAACGQFLWAWGVESGQPLAQIKIDRLHFQAVAFTPNGRYLGAVRNDQTARFWDTTTWREHVAFDWEIGPLVSLDIARDGLRAAAGSKRGKIVVWDIDF